MINLIDQHAQINAQLQAFPNASLTVSIFGTQASGKSTILNCAFATQFPVLDTSKSRGRCTKGVWFQNVDNKNIVDTEGFDSNERTEQQKIFEKQLSLFCVVLSDVIIVNMFMYQIGRYTGGHLDILESIFKVGERLVTPQKKRIIFVIRDCSEDAEKSVLKTELQEQINKILKKYENKILKCNFDFVFMSHYLYNPDKFQKEALELSAMTFKSKSSFSNYQQAERLIYIKQLWGKIKSFETEIDLKSIDDALKNHSFERLKQEILVILHQELPHYLTLNQAKSYARYIQALKKASHDYYTEHRPKHIKAEEVQAQSNKVFELFEPEATKHFNQNILATIENQLQNELNSEIDKNKKNKKFTSTIFKKKKEIVEQYKKIVNNHKQSTLLVKHFNERISQVMSREQKKFSHLFNLFQITAEKQLNLQMDKQVNSLEFNQDLINRKIKSLCQQYQYNEWEVNFKQIWERVTFRCMDKIIPQYIEEKSVKVNSGIWILSGSQNTNIIAYHTRMQKKIIIFCRQILQYLHEEGTFSQPLSRIKDFVRQNLAKRLMEESRRFKISLVLISILLLLLYGEIGMILGWAMKKKTKKYFLRIYWYGALILLLASLYREYRGKGNVLPTEKESQATNDIYK